jgi:uncharacterized membrane protein YtjA (UPF0391 family)
MLYWALLFLVVAIVAGIFGFGGIAATASSIAQVLFFIFLVLFIVSLFFGWRGGAFGPWPLDIDRVRMAAGWPANPAVGPWQTRS